ncbi:OmpA family protein [uncultured Bacteroides sp.]|uniref:OmpA family protein n=1 Tax=uncultured Bacteroides sp. TaxID=162156 RepID=UPI002AAAF377|nr:OmpA family protein [uncultured Bacteroides sp.]
MCKLNNIAKYGLRIFLYTLLCTSTYAQNSKKSSTNYDAFNIALEIDKVGRKNLSAIYEDQSGRVFLPVEELFNDLKIKYQPSKNGKVIKGYIETDKKNYIINAEEKAVVYQGVTYALSDEDFILDMGMLYLLKEKFEHIFGFNINFNFRSLSAKLGASFELPLIKQMRLENARASLMKIKNEIVYDSIMPRDYHLFRFGMVDWSITSNRSQTYTGETRIGLGTGAEILGGETNVWLNYSDSYGLNRNQQRYYWRWVDNKMKVAKQVQLGRIYTKSISSLLYPVDGFMITNAPSTVRKALGDYQISDYTQPDWLVELYINNVLMDYTRADASGLYSFKVPIVYGTTNVMLRFYGPNGEERSEEKIINMPYNLLPKGEFEYRLTGGTLLDSSHSKFSRAEVNLGITRGITVGGGFEYLSSIKNNKSYIPFANVSLQPIPKLVLTGEYAHEVRTKGTLNYMFLHNSVLELNYSKYNKDQTAIIYNYLEERVASLSVPYRINIISGLFKGGFRQNKYSNFSYNTGELMMSGYYMNYNANLNNSYNWTALGSLNMYSNLAFGMRVNRGCNVRLNGQYSYTNQRVISYKAELEKQVFRNGLVTVGYEKNLLANYNSVNISFKYDLSFMTTYLSTYFNNKRTETSESARGSMAFGSGHDYVYADKQNAVGRCGISIQSFLDVNHNGCRDIGEPAIEGTNVRCNGGQIVNARKDSIIRIFGLEPFVDYSLTVDESNFDNLAWKVLKKNIRVTTDPNQFKKIMVAVQPMGEITSLALDENKNGMGHVLFDIYKENGDLFTKMQSESDGYISFLGLPPGKYTARVDSMQLARLNKTANSKDFTIHANAFGDIIDLGDIVLRDIEPKTADAVSVSIVNKNYKQKIDYPVLFDSNKADIKPENDLFLSKMAAIIKQYPCLTLSIEGNTDSDGTKEYNQKLSEKRAKAVKDYLMKRGVPSRCLEIIGYGENKPLNKNRNKAEKAANRRIEFINISPDCKVNMDSLLRADIKDQDKLSIKSKKKIDSQSLSDEQDKKSERPILGNYAFKDVLIIVQNGKYYLQIGAFKLRRNAQNLCKKVNARLSNSMFVVEESSYFKVKSRYFSNQQEARKLADKLKSK